MVSYCGAPIPKALREFELQTFSMQEHLPNPLNRIANDPYKLDTLMN